MRRRRRWLLGPAIALFALAARGEALTGKPAPPFDLPALGGESRVSLGGLAGKIVVLHFGTGW